MVAGTPLPRRRDGTRARIRSAALDLFGERGFEGTSMRDVAGRVGCTAAALYYHFDGKDALLSDLVTPFLEEVETLLAVAADTPVRGVLGDYLDVLLAHAPVVQLLQRDLAVRAHPALGPRHDAHLDRLHAQLAGNDEGDAATARVSASLGALRGPVLQGGLDLPPLRDVILDAAVAALGPPLEATR